MTKFILLCLGLGILVKLQSPYQEFFKTIEMFYFGIACMCLAIIVWLLKKTSRINPFDWFAMGTLLCWFYRWHQFYRDDAPMFYLFPLFFAIVTALVTVFLVDQRENFDYETIEYFQYFSDSVKLNTGGVVACVILSLFLNNHFILYPVAMIVYILRFVFSTCLQDYQRQC